MWLQKKSAKIAVRAGLKRHLSLLPRSKYHLHARQQKIESSDNSADETPKEQRP